MLQPKDKVAIYMEGHLESDFGKMGFGSVRYLANDIVAVIDSAQAGREMSDFMNTSRSIPVVASLEESIALGAEVLLLGIAPVGGKIPEFWYETLDQAVDSGISLINGLHDLLAPRYEGRMKQNWVRVGKCIALYMAFLPEIQAAGFPAPMADHVVSHRVRPLQIRGLHSGSTCPGIFGAQLNVKAARGSGNGDAAS